MRLAGELVDRAGKPLGQPPAVDEDQRRAVRANELDEPRMDRRPDRRRRSPSAGPLATLDDLAEPRHVLDRHLDRELDRPPHAGVDDRDGPERRRSRPSRGELVVDLVRATSARVPVLRLPRAMASTVAATARPAGRRRRGNARPRRAAAASRTIRCAAAAAGASASSRSSDNARCAPRLVGTSAWISSTMTVSIERSTSRAFEVRSRYSDSGVVIRMSAGWRWKRARSAAACRPCEWRWPADGRHARRSGGLAMPTSGARRLRSTSMASALSGET